MAAFRVTHIRKIGPGLEDITWLGNPSEKWCLPTEKVLKCIQNRTHIIYLEKVHSISPLGIFLSPVSQKTILCSFSGGKWNDWLLSLSEYPADLPLTEIHLRPSALQLTL